MELKIDRKARRRIEEAGGLITIEARAKMGCLVRTDVAVQTGKPEEPALFTETEVDGVRIFARGLIERADGTEIATATALPKKVRLREDGGALSVQPG